MKARALGAPNGNFYRWLLDGSTKRTHALHFPGLVDALDEKDFLTVLRQPSSKRPKNLLRPSLDAYPAVGEMLRDWVDEWLDSGVEASGGEDPKKRLLKKRGPAAMAVYNFFDRGAIKIIPASTGFAPYIERTPRTGAGQLTLGFPLAFGGTSVKMAEEEFAIFMMSDLRWLLCKCRAAGCGKYFVLNTTAASYYKRGMRCDDCKPQQRREAKGASKDNVRTAAAKELYRLTAEKFGTQIMAKGVNWHTDLKLAASIPRYLSLQIERTDKVGDVLRPYKTGGRNGVQDRWLRRKANQKGIEAAVSALTNA